jgi:DNA polymerase-3 subunit delta
MKVGPDQLARHLQDALQPIYMICGDEPLQALEAADQIRKKARGEGFDERQVFHIDQSFDWNLLTAEASAMSLFASRKILDLRMPSGKPGREGGEWLREFVANANPDNLLMLSCGRMTNQQLKAKWASTLVNAGVLVQCWPIELPRLPGWLDQRMKARGMQPEAAATRALADRVEGNLLAAAQEVDKLLLVHGEGPVTLADIEDLVADSSRFDVFRLVDTALAGNVERALRIAASLQKEGTPLAIVSWAFTKEVRLLCQMRETLNQGGNLQGLMRGSGMWDSRRTLVQQAMRRMSVEAWRHALRMCGQLDRMLKGQAEGEPWRMVDRLALFIASGKRIKAAV